jgi:hypothetical protein
LLGEGRWRLAGIDAVDFVHLPEQPRRKLALREVGFDEPGYHGGRITPLESRNVESAPVGHRLDEATLSHLRLLVCRLKRGAVLSLEPEQKSLMLLNLLGWDRCSDDNQGHRYLLSVLVYDIVADARPSVL